MKAMETFHDLIEEVKVRTTWWALCIFAVSYFLSHTSKSMWTNVPISFLLIAGLRVLFSKVEFHWKVRAPVHQRTSYLSHLEKRQLPVNHPWLSAILPSTKWKRKIDSPVVESAIDELVNRLLQEFVIDLWYSAITPDMEVPEQIRVLLLDAIGEISRRVKEINLVDLLTRDVVDLIGDHLDLYRRNQSAIGVDVMGTLSSEERDERLKHHLMASKELHPALISSECEYKVLQHLMGGVLAVVLKPREAQCPLVRCIARELLTCLVIQPVMNFASPGYINELIEYLFLTSKEDKKTVVGDDQSVVPPCNPHDHSVVMGDTQGGGVASKKVVPACNQQSEMILDKTSNKKETSLDASRRAHSRVVNEFTVQQHSADWARMLEAATQRRTEILAPENLENMWSRGRNYKHKLRKLNKAGIPAPIGNTLRFSSDEIIRNSGNEVLLNKPADNKASEDRPKALVIHGTSLSCEKSDGNNNMTHKSQELTRGPYFEGDHPVDKLVDNSVLAPDGNNTRLKRSSSTSALKTISNTEETFSEKVGGPIVSEEFYSPDFVRHKGESRITSSCDMVCRSEGLLNVPKLKCRVIGAFFEKFGTKSFAVYSIVVTDAQNKSWFVKRRYSNFERLHRNLKDIPNYTLHLPPKRIFSSSTDDSFVHRRCIQLDKYLRDLLSIANVAEQHEVWDFLSISSKNYSFGKSSSVMRTLAVNVDDAVDDIVRQFKGVSDGLMRKVVGSSSPYEASPSVSVNLSQNTGYIDKYGSSHSNVEASRSFSDNEEGGEDGSHGHKGMAFDVQVNGWHSDNELNSKGFPPRIIKRDEASRGFESGRNQNLKARFVQVGPDGNHDTNSMVTSDILEDPVAVPPEWSPPNVSVPVLNLVDKIFQLKRRGWLRRQVFWISKQILQLMMEDAIDDWLLRQIHWLRRDDTIAQGIHWVQDVLWPNGIFFLKLDGTLGNMNDTDQEPAQTANYLAANRVSNTGSFELQLEAARRASDVKKLILGGAPTALVSLIGHKQYRRCAKDIYYFLQSAICVKQLAYGILELLLISIFPELRDLVLDVHQKA